MVSQSLVVNKWREIERWVWQPGVYALPIWQRLLIQMIRIIYAVFRDLRDGQLSLRAMSLVYTTVIAIVPFLALAFLVLKGFGLHNEVQPALLSALEDLGEKRFDIVDNIMSFIDNVKVGVLGAVGFALLIWSVISMMHKIEHSFNYTWQIKRGRGMSERFRDYLSVVFVAPLLIFLSAAITTSMNTGVVVPYIEALPYGSNLVTLASNLVPYLMMSLGFAFIYTFLPNTKVKFFAAFVGGMVTAVVWKVMGWGVSTFVANSASSIAIYSAFASIIILMVWMYIGWLVLLVGASIAFYVQNPQYILIRRDDAQLSGESREKLALSILFLVGQHYQQNRQPWSVDSLARELKIAPHCVDDMVSFLQREEFIVEAEEHSGALFPRRPLDKILVSDVLRCVREQQQDGRSRHAIACDNRVDSLFHDFRSRIDEQFGRQTLLDLVSADK